MIKNYIFDFGNVLARFYPHELTAPYVADPDRRAKIVEVAFDRTYWAPLDEGTITDDEVKAAIRGRLSAEDGELGCLAYDNWVKNLVPVEGMPQVVADLKKAGGRIYLVSNISQKFAAEYKENPWVSDLFATFDGLIFSSDYKICKPCREIFEILLERYDLNPEECLFVDDLPANIQGAAAVGIKGYQFDGNAPKLREFIGV